MYCKLCFDNLTNDNEVLYRINTKNNFIIFDYCYDCMIMLMSSMFTNYIKLLRTADCEASLIRLIKSGPPFYFKDHLIENNQDIIEFSYNDKIISGILPYSLNKINYDNFIIKLNLIDFNLNYIDQLNNILTEFNL